ncbi:velvet factor-domain-containing protein, partial [Daedaleopsis nitida]
MGPYPSLYSLSSSLAPTYIVLPRDRHLAHPPPRLRPLSRPDPRPARPMMARPHDPREYELTMRQEPKQARMCGVGADRRPIDPPPIVQLRVVDPTARRPQSSSSRASSPDSLAVPSAQSFLQNPYYFMFACLAKPDEDVELHWLKDGKTRCTTGSVVSSLYHLKDSENQNTDAGFFVFPDLSVRTEGSYRLKLTLYETVGNTVYFCKSIFSAPFYVYTAKKFPGMEESTPLSCSLADQGIKIRIRKDIRVRKRPVAALDTPIPIPMGPVPIPHGAFGPVPVPLDDDDDDVRERERERERERDRDRDRERDRERERERRESGGSIAGPSGSGSISRRESSDGRGAKRVRGGDEPMVEDASTSNPNVGWGLSTLLLHRTLPQPRSPLRAPLRRRAANILTTGLFPHLRLPTTIATLHLRLHLGRIITTLMLTEHLPRPRTTTHLPLTTTLSLLHLPTSIHTTPATSCTVSFIQPAHCVCSAWTGSRPCPDAVVAAATTSDAVRSIRASSSAATSLRAPSDVTSPASARTCARARRAAVRLQQLRAAARTSAERVQRVLRAATPPPHVRPAAAAAPHGHGHHVHPSHHTGYAPQPPSPQAAP